MSIMCSASSCKKASGACLHEKVMAVFGAFVLLGGTGAVLHFALHVV